MDPFELYRILHEKALNMTGAFNVIDLSRKILELSKRSRDEVLNINNTFYFLMIIHADKYGLIINENQPILNGRSFGENKGVTYTINSDCQIDDILMKMLYLYVSNVTTV